MPHRDALEAALARVAALEAELAELQGVRGEHSSAERQVAALRSQLADAQRTIAAMRPPTPAGLPNAHTHNLGFEPHQGERAGLKVACPRCAMDQVERELFPGVVGNSYGTMAVCPACGYIMFVRTA